MPRTRDIIDAVRVATLWLLMASVFLGPAGPGGSAALAAAAKTCGVSCPCDEAVHNDDHAGDHAGDHDGDHSGDHSGDHDADHDADHSGDHSGDHGESAAADPCDDHSAAGCEHNDEPCQEECPDDCPNCGCCLGVAMAVLPLPFASSATSCASSARIFAPVDASARGACTGVFRPPRSLT